MRQQLKPPSTRRAAPSQRGRTLGILAISIASLVVALAPARADAKGGSGTGVPDAIWRPGDTGSWLLIPREDDDQLWYSTMFVAPTPLATAPDDLGAGMLVRSGYWGLLSGAWGPDGVTTATYYPLAGAARIDVGDATSWYRLDAGRRGLLDRYAAILNDPALPDEPSELAVLAAAGARTGHVVVRIDHQPLDAVQTAMFWRFASALDATAGSVRAPAIADAPAHPTFASLHTLDFARGIAVDVVLPEGRTIFYTYAPDDGVLFDYLGRQYSSFPGYPVAQPFAGWVAGVAARGGNGDAARTASAPPDTAARALLAIAVLAACGAAAGLAAATYRSTRAA
jgi:hypothetical protein